MSQPNAPDELWMLWSDEFADWVVSSDSFIGYIALISEADAVAEAEYQAKHYDITCRPIRVK